ncbi:alpha/beta hydrolase [Pseudonocardia benzenivorans]
MTTRTDTDLELTSRWGGRLAATFTPGTGDSAVLLLHGFLSDRRAGGRFDRLADEYSALGHAVLRIDLSGFGSSEGDVVDADRLLDDAHTALDHLDALGLTRQILHGQSLGSAIALRVAPLRPRVATLVLTGALTGAGNGDAPYRSWTTSSSRPGTATRTCGYASTVRSRARTSWSTGNAPSSARPVPRRSCSARWASRCW